MPPQLDRMYKGAHLIYREYPPSRVSSISRPPFRIELNAVLCMLYHLIPSRVISQRLAERILYFGFVHEHHVKSLVAQ